MGATVGVAVGATVGVAVGAAVGVAVGFCVGVAVGSGVGVGFCVGVGVGATSGTTTSVVAAGWPSVIGVYTTVIVCLPGSAPAGTEARAEKEPVRLMLSFVSCLFVSHRTAAVVIGTKLAPRMRKVLPGTICPSMSMTACTSSATGDAEALRLALLSRGGAAWVTTRGSINAGTRSTIGSVASQSRARLRRVGAGAGAGRASETHLWPSQNTGAEPPFGNPADLGGPVALRPRLATGVLVRGVERTEWSGRGWGCNKSPILPKGPQTFGWCQEATHR